MHTPQYCVVCFSHVCSYAFSCSCIASTIIKYKRLKLRVCKAIDKADPRISNFRTVKYLCEKIKKKSHIWPGRAYRAKKEKNNLVSMPFYCNVAVERDVLLVSVQIAEMGARSCGPLRSACPRSSIFPLCSVLPRSCTTF